MKIGIIGTNDRATAIGRLLGSGGHMVSFGDPVNPDRAARAAAVAGARTEAPYRQAMTSDLLVLAVPPDQLDQAVRAVGSGAEATIVDATDGHLEAAPRSTAEALAHKLDTHRVVRALIVLPQSGANVPICGDDPSAKALVAQALRASGCRTTDRGPLSSARELERSWNAAA